MPEAAATAHEPVSPGGRRARLTVALVSIGHCPSLATRNLRRYCLAHDDVRSHVDFILIDRDLREFLKAPAETSRRMSFATAADETLASLRSLRPDVIALSCYLWNTDCSIRLASQAKALLPQTQIVLGGPDVGPRAAELLARHPEVDVIVNGDGEVPFLELVRRYLTDAPAPLASVPQVTYRDAGLVVSSAVTPRDADMSLLRDVYENVPTREELRTWGFPTVLYETQRGCPYPCSYCMYGRIKPNRKDTAVVVEELRGLLGRGLMVELIDPTFTTNRKRAKEILRGLAGTGATGRLWFEAYPDSIDDEMVGLMKQANVAAVGIGFQTLSADGLGAVARPRNLAAFEQAVHLLRAAGIHFWVDVIYGLPTTTAADFVATMDYLHALGVRRYDIYRLLGLPGSPLMHDAAKYGLVFSASPPYEMLSSSTFSIEDILFCNRFTETMETLRNRTNAELFHRLCQLAGSLSALVRLVMDSGVALDSDDPAPLNRVLAGLLAPRDGVTSQDRSGTSRLHI